MIHVMHAQKTYNRGTKTAQAALQNISFDLPDQGMVAIFGPSGCGKTTLLNAIGGLDRLDSGMVLLDGELITTTRDDLRNRDVGYIFQNYNLNTDETCFENVSDALRLIGITDEAAIRTKTMEALRAVGMDAYEKRLPLTLSGGQQQRIAIARAIVKNPKVVLADEPTGNLDEANTVMIMDLLKSISKETLVLLVTHEAQLVEYYCSQIIELKDGQIVGIEENTRTGGYKYRGKSQIYLGELPKQEFSSSATSVEYYGAPLDQPLKLRLVNYEGKLYVEIGKGTKVQILDSTTETQLVEGVYEPTESEAQSKAMEWTPCPYVEKPKYGVLYTFKKALMAAFSSRSKTTKKKKGQKLLYATLALFSAVFVIFASTFGVAIKEYKKVNRMYDPEAFYVLTSNKDVTERLEDLVNIDEAAVDYVQLFSPSSYGLVPFEFESAYFESASTGDTYWYYSSSPFALDCYAAIYRLDYLNNPKMVCGTTTIENSSDIVISTGVADQLLEASTFSFVESYKDLLYLRSSSSTYRIVGIVNESTPAVYVSDDIILDQIVSTRYSLPVEKASDYGFQVDAGNVLYFTPYDGSSLTKGKSVVLSGRTYTVDSILQTSDNYDDWLDQMGYNRIAFDDISEDEHYGEQIRLRYAKIDEYLESLSWYSDLDYYLMYLIHPCTTTEAMVLMGYEDPGYWEYYVCTTYYDLTGHDLSYADFEDSTLDYDSAYNTEERQFWNSTAYESIKESRNIAPYYDIFVLVSDEDYKTIYTTVGESVIDGSQYETNAAYYTMLHSTDVERTETYLLEHFDDIPVQDYYEPILTPSTLKEYAAGDSMASIIGNAVALVIFVFILSLCMFLMMKSSTMSCIREIGIARAIGVNKRNLHFRFFMESALIAVRTISPGFVVASAFVWLVTSRLSSIDSLFYYPVWFALCVLLFLFGACVLFGTAPIRRLLRKTPSQILTQYDI